MITLVVLLLGLAGQQCLGTTLNCSSLYNRYPVDSDLTVTCGPQTIVLTINACPVQFAEFDPTSLALNGKQSMNNCIGALDTTVDPPVVTFVFPINDTTENICGNSITIEDHVGSGIFASFSHIQTVVISGYVNTPAITETTFISYSTNLNYNFSCYYPLQYMLNNTELLTSSANIAVNTNNGSFISTLSMQIFSDENFTIPLQFNANGSALPLKKNVYVQVTATNLTANFNVLLDECYATPSPLLTTESGSKFSLLSGCVVANKTKILTNGLGKYAQFSFETFRFLQHSSQSTSTIYLHCATRLCQPDTCVNLLQTCNAGLTTPAMSRRKRAAAAGTTEGTTERVTVSSGPIYTTDGESTSASQTSDISEVNQLQGTLTGLIVGIIIAALLGVALAIVGVILYKMSRFRTQSDKNGVDNFTFNGK